MDAQAHAHANVAMRKLMHMPTLLGHGCARALLYNCSARVGFAPHFYRSQETRVDSASCACYGLAPRQHVMFMSCSSSYTRNYHGHMRELKSAGDAGPRDSPPLGLRPLKKESVKKAAKTIHYTT